MSGASTEQATLAEFEDIGRCQAISMRSSRRCKHDALPGVPYCADHYHLLENDEVRSAKEPFGVPY
jgi:hypothetical protein